jgi:hypothetical protein
MTLDRQQLRQAIHELYRTEHAAMGERGTLDRLDQARRWDLAPTLRAGGVLVFPHAGVFDCGHQTAAVVNACLDSGADRVIVVSVLHAFTDEMQEARVRVAQGDDPARWPFWGIQGPGLPDRTEWREDHSLTSFRHFWAAETRRRGTRGPEVIERYPCLVAGAPERLPGLDALARLAEDSVVISTADPFHHGIGYGDPPERALHPQDGGLDLARRTIEEGIEILGRGDYWGYNQHCVRARNDARDAGPVFRYLRGAMRGRIVDLTYTDTAELYRQPKPTWVAAALIDWQPARRTRSFEERSHVTHVPEHHNPSRANQETFETAVRQVALAGRRLFDSLQSRPQGVGAESVVPD